MENDPQSLLGKRELENFLNSNINIDIRIFLLHYYYL